MWLKNMKKMLQVCCRFKLDAIRISVIECVQGSGNMLWVGQMLHWFAKHRIATAATVAFFAFLATLLIQYESCNNLFLSKLGICRLQTWMLPSKRGACLQYSLLWMAPFFSTSGYGSEALSYVTALKETGSLPSLKIVQHGDLEDYQYWSGLPHRTKQLLLEMNWHEVRLNETVVICHSEPGAWYPPLFQTVPCPPMGYEEPLYVIGRTMFETDRLTPEHVKRCNAMDEVWVPSGFNIGTFVKSGVAPSKLVRVAQTVDVHFFNPSKVTPLQLPTAGHAMGPKVGTEFFSGSPFIFLSIFKWEARKGWDILIRAYLEEFSAEDNTVLYLVTNAYHTDSDFGNRIMEFVSKQGILEPSAGWPSVHVHDSHVPQVDLPRLYKAASAFVLPSRGEGWGRPHVEAMAMGLPVIATNWSGSTEYMTEHNSYRIPLDGMSEILEGAFKGHFWAEPSLSGLRKLMRHVMLHPSEAKAKGAQARKDMVSKYSPQVISGSILKELSRIQEKLTLQRFSSQQD